MTGSVLAVTINAQGGSYLTMVFPLGLFCVVAAVLYYVVFARPHPRVPPRRLASVQAATPDPATARASAAAAGMPTAAGGGSTEGLLERPGAAGATLAGATAAGAPGGADQAEAARAAPGGADGDDDGPGPADAGPQTAPGTAGRAAGAEPGNVSGQEGRPADAADPGPGTRTEGTEASE